MSELQYPRLWLAVGCFLLLLVVYLSLADLSLPQFDTSVGDKINHLLAYGFLMGWFGQLIPARRWWIMAVALVSLGLVLEFIQGTLAHRWFDIADASANTAGVVIALCVLAAGGNRLLAAFERYWQSK